MDNTKGKIICTAQYQTLTDGKSSIVYDNNKYGDFYMVEHEWAAANYIFKSIHKSDDAGFADCFPPVISGTKLVLAHRVTGTTLEDWLNNSSNLVLKDSNGNAIQITDKLKSVIQDLGFIVLHSINSGINIHLTMEKIFVSNCQPPQVLGVAASLNQDNGKTSLESLTSLFKDIWTTCKITNNKEADLITHSFRWERPKVEYQQFLYSPTFWTKQVRIYVIIRLGEIVTSVKNFAFTNLERPQDVLQWRTIFSSDPKLQNLVGRAPKNNSQGQPEHDSEEVDCGIRFLSSTLAHFERMCKRQTNLGSRVEMIEHYDLHYPDMMNTLYKAVKPLEKAFRS